VLGFEEEARAVGEEIEQLQRNDGSGRPHPLDEIAILVRASFRCASSRTVSSRSGCPIA
jgi:superfamily I DNA/RNA helicase